MDGYPDQLTMTVEEVEGTEERRGSIHIIEGDIRFCILIGMPSCPKISNVIVKIRQRLGKDKFGGAVCATNQTAKFFTAGASSDVSNNSIALVPKPRGLRVGEMIRSFDWCFNLELT